MRITDAYIVIIDFDGDIASEVVGTHVFTTIKETMDIVRQALIKTAVNPLASAMGI